MAKRSKMEEELPVELVQEILLRVPVKPLHRFLCVSKPWYSLISNPSFHKHHFRLHQHNPLLLLIQNEHDKIGGISHLRFSTCTNQGHLLNQFSKTVPIPINNRSHTFSFQPIQSCYGLVCLQAFRPSRILLCNPSTHHLIALPPPSSNDSFSCIGFGYAASTHEFKVVSFFHRQIDNAESCEIFTLGTAGGWREARSPPPFHNRWGAPFVHGSLHLITSEDIAREHHKIVCFNIDSEEYGEIPLPKTYFGEARSLLAGDMDFAEYMGSLCLTFDFAITEKRQLEFWFLKDYNNGMWVKQYIIDLPTDCSLRPQAIIGDGRILSDVFRQGGCDLQCYNTHDKCFERDFLGHKIDGSWTGTLYVESFLHLEK